MATSTKLVTNNKTIDTKNNSFIHDLDKLAYSPPPWYSLGHPFGDNPLRGANEEEGRNPAGRGLSLIHI